ncbi:MAG: hypothetical protein WC763_04230 [Candidatus Paceibacterota bacterium]|jgi:hypothetical protein
MDSINFLNLEYIFLRIAGFFKGFDIVAILNSIIKFIGLITPVAIVVALFLLYVILYAYIRLKKLEKVEEKKFHALRFREVSAEHGNDPVLNQKWMQVETHINSTNPSDWRLAILEADIMLGDVLNKMGYQGDSIGEQLKGVEESDFLTLQDAWEAHRVRNQVAHEGSDFQLNERDAKRIIGLYKKVFSEFFYI